MSTRYETSLIGSELCGTDIMTARFERPAGYDFRAGQWMRMSLKTPGGEEARTFTHASAPADEWLEITTRLSDSAFKRALVALRPGDRATFVGPGGRLTLPSPAKRVAFLVGGVGITPVRSMLRDAVQSHRHFSEAVVFYGNRDPSCVPYREELEAMSDHGVRVVHVFERGEEGAGGERGFISAAMVGRHLERPSEVPFVVAGPPVMVRAMVPVLDELEVSSELRRIEWFGTAEQV